MLFLAYATCGVVEMFVPLSPPAARSFAYLSIGLLVVALPLTGLVLIGWSRTTPFR